MKENIRKLERKRCTGCGSCATVCPNQAIQLKSISEGFLYPFLDEYICDFCGKCSECCPEMTKCISEEKTVEEYVPQRYAFAASDEIRWNSEDGGVKQVVMKSVLENGGKICVPVFTNDFLGTAYEIIESWKELENKILVQYVECDASKIFPNVKKLLEKEELLLFLGTPCQNAGLKRYLQKEYENLLVGDLICRGVTSLEAWVQYVNMISNGEMIQRVRFGAKELGLGESIRILFGEDDLNAYDGVGKDVFLQAYRRGLSLRKCCFSCGYGSAQGDLGFSNFYEINKYKRGVDDKKGISYLAVYTHKAEQILDNIRKDARIFERVENATLEGKPIIKCREDQRQAFWEYWEIQGWKDILRHVDNTSKTSHKTSVYALDYHTGDSIKWKICNREVWLKKSFDGHDVLFTDGHTLYSWILIPLLFVLENGVKYEYDIRFKCQTKTRNVRLLLADNLPDKDNVSAKSETLWTQNIPDNTWIRIKGTHVTKRSGMRYFYLSSTDFTGEGSYVCLDWIRIWKS